MISYKQNGVGHNLDLMMQIWSFNYSNCLTWIMILMTKCIILIAAIVSTLTYDKCKQSSHFYDLKINKNGRQLFRDFA